MTAHAPGGGGSSSTLPAGPLVCPRCGSADLQPREVDRDGNVTLACGDPNCGTLWTARPLCPEAVPDLRELGAQLAANRRAVDSSPRDLPVSSMLARGAVRRCQEQILGRLVA